MKRVRFETVRQGQKCRTEWKENAIKTNEVRIQTEGKINYRNAVDLDTGELIPIDSCQYVYVEE